MEKVAVKKPVEKVKNAVSEKDKKTLALMGLIAMVTGLGLFYIVYLVSKYLSRD